MRRRRPGHGHDRGAAVLGRFRRKPAPDAEAAGDDNPAGGWDATDRSEQDRDAAAATPAGRHDADFGSDESGDGRAAEADVDAIDDAAEGGEAADAELAGEGDAEEAKRLRIGIVLFDGVEELDWAGPWEVLAAWARYFPDDGVRVCTLAPSEAPVTCAKGARVLADHTWGDHPPLDVLIYPGGEGTRRQLGDMSLRRWLLDEAAQVSLVASVCTGALVLADAGLLDGRPATTHWASLEQLGGLGTDIEVRSDQRVVDDGDVVTAAGVSAGIDMALRLVARFAGEERAKQVQKIIEYFPEPPT